jgi:GT2 family glycosyltransferase
MEHKLTSVVMPVLDGKMFTVNALTTFRKNTQLPYEVIIVDNGSTDGTAEVLKDFPEVRIIRNEQNEGFVKAVNKGISAAKGEYIVIANNDILVGNRWLEKMVEVAEQYSRAGIISLMTTDGGINQSVLGGAGLPQLVGTQFKPEMTDELNALFENKFPDLIVEETNSIIFCLALIKREVIEKIGLLGEEFGLGFGDDGDFCIRTRKAGFKLIIRKDGFFYHFRRTTFGRVFGGAKILEMQKKNIGILERKHPEHFEKLPPRKLKTLKPMRILITNNHLNRLGGSETFTLTLAKELVDRGHNVEVFTFHEGVVSNLIKEFAKVVAAPDRAGYDLMLINHTTCLSAVQGIPGFKIFTSHGIYPQIEQPESGANAYVAISEEVRQHLKNKGYDSTVINNGIDCRKFKPIKGISEELKSVLCLCQDPTAVEYVQEACRQLCLKFDAVRYPSNLSTKVDEKINEADLVVSLGRGAYEAMACGRSVIVFDMRMYSPLRTADGIVTQENADEIMKNNFSGRRFKLEWGLEDLIHEMKKYDPNIATFNRNFALENFNIEKQVDKYLMIKTRSEQR